MSQKILTLHPEGLKGVNIDRGKYDQVQQAIIDALKATSPSTFKGLREGVESRLNGKFEGSIGWYYTTVKLDLEARGVIACERGKKGSHTIELGDLEALPASD